MFWVLVLRGLEFRVQCFVWAPAVQELRLPEGSCKGSTGFLQEFYNGSTRFFLYKGWL